jgi:hypothetical protein
MKIVTPALVDAFFAPANYFVWHPDRIAVVAAVLFGAAVLGFAVKRKLCVALVVASFCWLCFVPWEYYCTVQRYNIRVDLLVIWPVLLLVTVWGLITAVRPQHARL